MRGADTQTKQLFSYVNLEDRIPAQHPLRAIRTLSDDTLKALSEDFDRLYSREGLPGIAPEKLAENADYQASQVVRKRVEEIFGWMKTIGVMAETRHRGLAKVDWQFTLVLAAYNLARMPKLLADST